MRTPPQFVGAFLFLCIAETIFFAYAWPMRRILYLLLFITFSLSAEVYRLVDKNGNVSFSDQHHPDATLVEIEALPTYTPTATQFNSAQNRPIQQQEPEPLFVPDYSVSIISPTNEQTFWENSGTVAVQVLVEPDLDKARGDLLTVSLDGNQIGEPQSTTIISLTEVNRGAHTLSVSVVSKDEQLLATSETISFQLHRRSVINQPNN